MVPSLLLFSFIGYVAAASYSVFYLGPDSHGSIENAPLLVLGKAPNAKHIADIVCRLNGLPPLLLEEDINMPQLSFIHGKHVPLIVELKDAAVMPIEAKSILTFTSAIAQELAPSLQSVITTLASSGVNAETKVLSSKELSSVLGLDRPVIVIQRDNSHRNLLTETLVSIEPLTEFQISNYQITLWTAVLMFLLILSAVCTVVQMEVIPDSLLFAKFQSSRTGRSD